MDESCCGGAIETTVINTAGLLEHQLLENILVALFPPDLLARFGTVRPAALGPDDPPPHRLACHVRRRRRRRGLDGN